MKTKIITARIDEQVFYQIEYLKQHLGVQNTTALLKQAVDSLYLALKKQEAKKTPFELLEECHVLGAFEAEEDLSKNYKKYLTQSLRKKHHAGKKVKKCMN